MVVDATKIIYLDENHKVWMIMIDSSSSTAFYTKPLSVSLLPYAIGNTTSIDIELRLNHFLLVSYKSSRYNSSTGQYLRAQELRVLDLRIVDKELQSYNECQLDMERLLTKLRNKPRGYREVRVSEEEEPSNEQDVSEQDRRENISRRVKAKKAVIKTRKSNARKASRQMASQRKLKDRE